MTNEELVSRVRAGIDKADNMLTLYNQNRGMIYTIAKKYSGYAELEDLAQEGYIGLCNAVESYDQTGGVPFVSYAWGVIRNHVLRFICAERNLPEYMQALIAQYRKLTESFLTRYGRRPFRAEYCHYMNISREKLAQIEKAACMEQTASIDSPINEEGVALSDTLAGDDDVEGFVLDKIQQGQLRAVLWEAVASLPGEQPGVIRKRYRDNMTLQQTMEELKIPTMHLVRSAESQALRRLRKNSRLRSFVEIRGDGMQGTGAEAFRRTWTSATERVALDLVGELY